MSDTATKTVGARKAVSRDRKAPIVLDTFAVIALVLGFAVPRTGTSTFGLATRGDLVALPPLAVPTGGTVTALALVLAGLAVAAHVYVLFGAARRVPIWLIAGFAVVFLVAFLTWASAGRTVPVPGLLIGSLALGTPLIFGALGGVIGERAGVVNVAIEGQLLLGAFSAAVVGSVTRQPVLGLVAAMAAGILVALVLAVFAIRYIVDQVIVGVVLNVLVIGLTGFLYAKVLKSDVELFNAPDRFPVLPIPGLSAIPIIGPVVFRQTIIVYLMYIAVFAVWFGLFKTRWGLRVRAVGEYPAAADTVGIDVNRTRFRNVALAGAVAGVGGAYFTLDSVGAFNKEMTNGMGFIALAAVIFGRWHPIRAAFAALLFGFATNLQSMLGIIGSPVPSEFMLMLPYAVTVFAVAGLAGRSRAPAAAGKPYLKS
ncbi:ABC transporter permease [Microtetraspora sp. NBRC 13810]|uniref:ABC transporter permease n=1 Tax=Microtetraspora sp. NBRC 13810 TaxID=3030990 RepID=UPI002557539D|nr:ABC transporter permease [Microtetraspora sp. NBRC 13810]